MAKSEEITKADHEKTVAGVKVLFTSDVYRGQKLDTAVKLESHVLCFIAGDQIDNFSKELDALITKYQI